MEKINKRYFVTRVYDPVIDDGEYCMESPDDWFVRLRFGRIFAKVFRDVNIMDCKSMRKAWVGYSDFSQFYHGSYNNMFANCTYVDGLFEYLPGDKKAEEYVVYYDGILAFFNDRHRMSTSRYAYIYDLNEGTNHTGWYDRRFLIETVWFAKNCKYTIQKNGYGYYPSDYFNEPVNAKTCFEWFF